MLALPQRVVGVLQGRLRQRRGAAGGEGRVERRQLAQEDGERPAVEDDVVDGEEEGVLGRGAAQQQGALERPFCQVERPLYGAGEERLGFSRRRRQGREVNDGKRRRGAAR